MIIVPDKVIIRASSIEEAFDRIMRKFPECKKILDLRQQAEIYDATKTMHYIRIRIDSHF